MRCWLVVRCVAFVACDCQPDDDDGLWTFLSRCTSDPFLQSRFVVVVFVRLENDVSSRWYATAHTVKQLFWLGYAIKLMFRNDDRQIMLIYMWQITHTRTHGEKNAMHSAIIRAWNVDGDSLCLLIGEGDPSIILCSTFVDCCGQPERSLVMMITIETVKCVWNLFTTRARQNTNKITIFALVRLCVFYYYNFCSFFLLLRFLFNTAVSSVFICVLVTVLSIY